MPFDSGNATDLAKSQWQASHARATAALADRENRLAKEDMEARLKERREADGKREPLTHRKRRKELRMLLARRYGFDSITDTHHHAHVDVIELAAHMLASPYRDKAADAVREWCGRCSHSTVEDIMRRARGILPRRADMNATACGQRVCLSAAERAALDIQTIRAFDETPQETTRRRRARERVTAAKARAKRRPDTSGRTCESCGTAMPEGRADRRFCGAACKKRWQRQHGKRVPITVTDQLAKQASWRTTLSGTAAASQAPAPGAGVTLQVADLRDEPSFPSGTTAAQNPWAVRHALPPV
jgi:hypothetical protein